MKKIGSFSEVCIPSVNCKEIITKFIIEHAASSYVWIDYQATSFSSQEESLGSAIFVIYSLHCVILLWGYDTVDS